MDDRDKGTEKKKEVRLGRIKGHHFFLQKWLDVHHEWKIPQTKIGRNQTSCEENPPMQFPI